jgi:ribosomal protein S15P/S13E
LDTELVETDRTDLDTTTSRQADIAELTAGITELIKVVHQQNEILQEQQQQFAKIVRYYKKQTSRPTGKNLIGKLKGMINNH